VRSVVSIVNSIKELLMGIHGKVSIGGGKPLLWRTLRTFPDTTTEHWMKINLAVNRGKGVAPPPPQNNRGIYEYNQ